MCATHTHSDNGKNGHERAATSRLRPRTNLMLALRTCDASQIQEALKRIVNAPCWSPQHARLPLA